MPLRYCRHQHQKTLVPVREESENFDETEHIFIEGENLEVLRCCRKVTSVR